jgi:hypothetical protein
LFESDHEKDDVLEPLLLEFDTTEMERRSILRLLPEPK